MKKSAVLIFWGVTSTMSFAQEVLNSNYDFLPNSTDSNNVYVLLDASVLFPNGEKNEFQKSLLVDSYQKGNRVFRGKLEILVFPSTKYTNSFEPHIFFRLEAFPMQYVASRLGAGVSARKLGSSLGVFIGQYTRRVPHPSNLKSHRGRNFEHHPLKGFYLQSSNEYGTLFFSWAQEKKRVFYFVKVSSLLGNTLSLGKEGSVKRSLGVVMAVESFTGTSIGLSISPIPKTHLEFMWIMPQRSEKNEQARLKYHLSDGWLISLGCHIN